MNPPPAGSGVLIPGAAVSAGAVAHVLAPASAMAPGEAPAHGRAAERVRARVAVLGASGYSGQEFARLALGHTGITLAALASREHHGQPGSVLLPGHDPRAAALPPVLDPSALQPMLERGEVDTLVSCLPHGAWRALVAEHPGLESLPKHIIDLSSDHRDGSDGYAYGLPEAFRSALTGASRVANPGCYPTAAALALMPAAERGWLAAPVMVSALSGVSGAGRAPKLRTSFVELEGGAAIYQAGSVHPHVGEMERTLERLSGLPLPIGFTPQLAPMARGILLTASAPLTQAIDPDQAHAAWQERYENEPFVRVLPPSVWPETRATRSSNRCDVAVTTLHGGRTLLVAAAIDNLVKGASGQALQNLNLMLGWPEAWGLPVHGSPW